MIIYAGIDGTSTETDTYERTYYNSFVNRLHRNELLPFDDTWYLRGPYLSGFDTDKRARACHHLGTRLLEKRQGEGHISGRPQSRRRCRYRGGKLAGGGTDSG